MWLAPAAYAAREITYDVVPIPAERQFAVTITIPNVKGESLSLQIPTWSPGAYIINNSASRIADVKAESQQGNSLNVSHPDKLTWSVSTAGVKEIKFSYKVTGADLVSVDGKPKRCHIAGPSTYMYVVGRKTEPARLAIREPAEWGWKAICSLDPAPGISGQFGHLFDAPNYDVLADAPVEMGDYAEADFTVRGVPHKVVMYGDYSNVNQPKLVDYCKRIVETEIAFFNDVPFKRYIFMFRCSPRGNGGGGGLEHLGSTEISVAGEASDLTRSVTAHEYFHLWNVKRIRPFVLGPFDYTGPVRTNNLWWSEGVTSYYGDLLTRRGGLNTDAEYLKHLGTTIGELQSNPARLKVTADESSFKVWDGGGSQGFGRLSYYTKGELIGLCMDLKLRHLTNNKHSLDDIMRSLYKICGKGNGSGFQEDAIRQECIKFGGEEMSGYYDKLVRSTEEMPFDECLGYAGLKGGVSEKPVYVPDVGMFAAPEAGKGLRVRFLMDNGPAAKAGLKSDDLILAIDGKSTLERTTQTDFRSRPAGTKLKLTVERGGEKQEIDYTIGSIERHPWIIETKSTTTPQEKHLKELWLAGK
jgi:predicted metalloprotease with PDZ domain